MNHLQGPYVYFVSFHDKTKNDYDSMEIEVESPIETIEGVRALETYICKERFYSIWTRQVVILNFKLLRNDAV